MGTRWSDSFRNAGVLYKYHLYILEFCTEAISGTKHNNNAKLKLIADALEKKNESGEKRFAKIEAEVVAARSSDPPPRP